MISASARIRALRRRSRQALGGIERFRVSRARRGCSTPNCPVRPHTISRVPTSSTRLQKATSYLMDVQMASIMPNAIPTPNSSNATSCHLLGQFFQLSRQQQPATGLLRILAVHDVQRPGREARRHGLHAAFAQQQSLHVSPCILRPSAERRLAFRRDEMPTHAMRRALIAAIQVVQSCNQYDYRHQPTGLGVDHHFRHQPRESNRH